MRLWHKDLIPYLPRQQLLGQWRECCAIAGRIGEKGSPGHVLVNKIVEYALTHFIWYARLVYKEMLRRGYTPDWTKFEDRLGSMFVCYPIKNSMLFAEWHTKRYLRQCLMNLEEKYDCGAVSDEEWKLILDHFGRNIELYL